MKYGIKSTFNNTDNTISFSTSDEINNGIDLESLPIGNYYILLKVTYSNSEIKYYSLANASEYNSISYYTITKNNCNNEINIMFDIYNDTPYMSINVANAESLPSNVYDIAIDPGHGGLDTGAKSGEYKESDIVLQCALDLKNKLENLGLKVFISRDGSESPKEDTANNLYDDNGRINILNESRAKLLISLHVNSNKPKSQKGGVEVYAPSNCNLDFATLLAKNITEKANTYYSEVSSFKKADGVYVRNFNNAEISAWKTKANKGNYEPYNITTSTSYHYIIRETGGICTNAFIDGRNTSYGKNKYYNSNVGIESYMIELGYMLVESDLNNILSNYASYMEAISQSIKSLYDL